MDFVQKTDNTGDNATTPTNTTNGAVVADVTATSTTDTTVNDVSSANAPAPVATPVAAPVTTPVATPVAAPVAAPAPVQQSIISSSSNDEQRVFDTMQNMTIYGNKSLQELHEIQARRSHLSAGITFSDPALRIPKPILDSLTIEMRFEKPSEIQASTLPIILGRSNLIAQAQSGAGKTIAFTIGMLSMVNVHENSVQAVCLTPTRELANQILDDALRPLSSRIPGIRMEEALPGRDIPDGMVCPSHIVVGTPGTVKRWLQKGYLSLQHVRIFVLDEADKMVEDRGLGAETIAIRTKLPPTCQILMFSATYTEEIIKLAKKITPRAYLVTPKNKEELVLDVIYQVRMDVTRCPGGKLQVLKDIYDFLTIQQSIVFVEKRDEAEKIAAMMRSAQYEVSTLHSDLLPEDRDRVMRDFREGRSKVLITTNVLARGVDVPAVAVVINYDLPIRKEGTRFVGDEATYLHRIGRCGRFGRRGTAITFLERPQDFALLESIERYFVASGGRITSEWDPNDVAGLTTKIESLPKGGEILPQAVEGNTAASSSVGAGDVKISLFTA